MQRKQAHWFAIGGLQFGDIFFHAPDIFTYSVSVSATGFSVWPWAGHSSFISLCLYNGGNSCPFRSFEVHMEGVLKILKMLSSSASLITIVRSKGMAWLSVVGWRQRRSNRVGLSSSCCGGHRSTPR